MDSIANTVQIPVIDISDANSDAPQQLLDAAVHYGFVFVANNEAGISPDLIKKLFQISQEFFALPREVKETVSINSNKAGKNHGWLSQGVEKLDPQGQKRPDVKEYVCDYVLFPHYPCTTHCILSCLRRRKKRRSRHKLNHSKLIIIIMNYPLIHPPKTSL